MSIFTSQSFLDACQLHVGQATKLKGEKEFKFKKLILPQNRLKKAEKTNWKKINNINQKSVFFHLEYIEYTQQIKVCYILQTPWQNLPLFQKYRNFKEFFSLNIYQCFRNKVYQNI